jgi:hypothetical protein
MSSLTICVYGAPAPQGSKRHLGKGVMVESSKKVKPWREAVKHAALEVRGRMPAMTGPVHVTVCFTVAKPASAPKTRVDHDRPRDPYPTRAHLPLARQLGDPTSAAPRSSRARRPTSRSAATRTAGSTTPIRSGRSRRRRSSSKRCGRVPRSGCAVLKPSGSIFVNLGDKYAGNSGQWAWRSGRALRRPRAQRRGEATQRTSPGDAAEVPHAAA